MSPVVGLTNCFCKNVSGLSGTIHGMKKSKLIHHRGLSRGKSDKQYTTLKTRNTGLISDYQIECACCQNLTVTRGTRKDSKTDSFGHFAYLDMVFSN